MALDRFDSINGDSMAAAMQHLRRMDKSLTRAWIIIATLSTVVLALFISLIAVSVGQREDIRGLKGTANLLPRPNVTFSSEAGVQRGLTYGGSLFRGSGFWAPRKTLPEGLADHMAVTAGDYVYILGGMDLNGTVLASVWKYDPLLHTYTAMADMPTPRYRFAAAAIGSTIYVANGRDKNDNSDPHAPLGDLLVYDTATNAWSRGPNSSVAHSDACAAAIGNKLYLVGGYDKSYGYLNVTEEYDPANGKWKRVADMPTPRGDLMCAALAGEVYALGGYYSPTEKEDTFREEMESFNPLTGIWTRRPPLLTPRGDAAVAVLPGDRLMLVGGEGHYRQNTQFKYPKHVNEVYYASDSVWVQKAMIPTARFRTAAAVSGGLAFVFGGSDQCTDMLNCPVLSNVEVYLDVDHPHIYLYLRASAFIEGRGYNDSTPSTIYPV